MDKYTISTRNDEKKFQVEANSYMEAAQAGVAQLIPDRDDVRPEPTSGQNSRQAGCFQGYYYDTRYNAENSIGPAFHVFRGVR
jgi:hypothetical protein